MPKEIYIDENGNERILSSSPSALSGLLDTDITTPSANQVLAYDGSKWGNVTPSYNDLSNKPDFTLHTLTGVGCTIQKGGYVQFGDCVYLTISVKMTTNHGGDQFLSGLPNTLRNGQCVFGMKDNDTDGVLVSARLSNGNLYVNGNMGNNVTYNFNGILC